jgi:DUF1016 N-terminal domain/UvrD-like helicase C-terminal domain
MNETTHNVVPAPFDTLHAELRSLIASSRQRLAGAVNAELTRLYWSVGGRLRTKVLGGADRAKYGDQLINRVGDQLAQEFGRGFEAKNLRRIVQFAGAFPDTENVASLMRHLSRSRFVNLLPLKTEPARQFYASQAKRPPSASSCVPNPAANRWSCCKCTKTASPWPNTGPNCHPKRSWSKSCMPLCLKRVSGWRGAGCCWGTWMTSDDIKVSKGLEFPVVALPGVGHMPANGEDEQEAARVFYVAATRATQRLAVGAGGNRRFTSLL